VTDTFADQVCSLVVERPFAEEFVVWVDQDKLPWPMGSPVPCDEGERDPAEPLSELSGIRERGTGEDTAGIRTIMSAQAPESPE
jgi:hypothetical protein